MANLCPHYKKYYEMSIKGKLKNSLIENIFSVRNSKDKKYKLITILGIKFKVKRNERVVV